MNYKVNNNKVFYTEFEAREFAKDLTARGIIGMWCKTYEPITHEYLGNGMTVPVTRSTRRAIYD